MSGLVEAFNPRRPNLKPAADSLAFSFQGESDVRGCFVLGHAAALSRSGMRGKMVLLGMIETFIHIVRTGHIVPLPRIQPVQRVPHERGGVG
jgi:hypothetical protein